LYLLFYGIDQKGGSIGIANLKILQLLSLKNESSPE
jgi:hypothetical protein